MNVWYHVYTEPPLRTLKYRVHHGPVFKIVPHGTRFKCGMQLHFFCITDSCKNICVISLNPNHENPSWNLFEEINHSLRVEDFRWSELDMTTLGILDWYLLRLPHWWRQSFVIPVCAGFLCPMATKTLRIKIWYTVHIHSTGARALHWIEILRVDNASVAGYNHIQVS